MKIVEMILLVVFIGAVFVTANLFINDMAQAFPERNLQTNISGGKYDYSTRVNSSVSNLQGKLAKIGDADSGWKVIGASLSALPTAFVEFFVVIFTTMGYALAIVTGFAVDLGIPSAFLAIITTALIVYIIVKALNWQQKTEV